jgi:hypothetical protein
VLRHALTLFVFFARKFRRTMHLPVSDFSEGLTQLHRDVCAMETPLKTEPPKE